jgi:hypothetical protein
LTYEDLIVALANELPSMSGSAMRLLIRLIACCIENGTNEISVSKYWLAQRTGLSRAGVTLAARELERLIDIKMAAGVNTRFTLPEDWFTPQRSMFAIHSRVENQPHSPTFQASSSLETRLPLANFPGRTSQLSRRDQPGNQAALANSVDELARKPGYSSQETRLDSTQNEQLTPNPLDRSNRVLSSVEPLLHLRDSIEGANFIPTAFADNAETLKRWLRSYFVKHHPSHNAPEGPDDVILAKCLAVAPLARLAQTLTTLDDKATTPRDSWAWFVTVFCQRIHKTKLWSQVKAPEGFQQTKKPASSEGGAQFSADLLQEVTAGVRTM